MTNAEAALKLIDVAAGLELIGNHENAEAVRMGANALRNPSSTLMGYRIAELQVLAELLREQDVSPITVSRLCKDVSYLYQLTNEQILNDIREAKKHIKLSPWKGEKDNV